MKSRLAVGLVLIVLLPAVALPSTWVDVDVTCPVCGTLNVFKMPASFGTYVYHDPSRFQYVFWPATTDTFLYTCRRCHLTAYMQDFAEIPADKITALAVMLEREGAIEGGVVPYFEIPMTVRLGIAREVYELLERDDEFWCEFERIAGYHYAESGQPSEAHRARTSALVHAESILERSDDARLKESLVVAGTMRFLTGDIAGARQAMDLAEPLVYAAPDRDSKALDAFLSQLIQDFRSELLVSRPR